MLIGSTDSGVLNWLSNLCEWTHACLHVCVSNGMTLLFSIHSFPLPALSKIVIISKQQDGNRPWFHTHTYIHIYMCLVWAACYINVTLNLWLWVCISSVIIVLGCRSASSRTFTVITMLMAELQEISWPRTHPLSKWLLRDGHIVSNITAQRLKTSLAVLCERMWSFKVRG